MPVNCSMCRFYDQCDDVQPVLCHWFMTKRPKRPEKHCPIVQIDQSPIVIRASINGAMIIHSTGEAELND